jgi:hypothetical protein
MQRDHAAIHNAPSAQSHGTLLSGSAAESRRRQSSQKMRPEDRHQTRRQLARGQQEKTEKPTAARQEASRTGRRRRRESSRRRTTPSTTPHATTSSSLLTWESGIRSRTSGEKIRRRTRRTSTGCSKSNESRTRGICRASQVTSKERPLTTLSSMPRKGCSQGRRSRGRDRLSKCSRTRGISRSCIARTT